jgi:hypothetical protein
LQVVSCCTYLTGVEFPWRRGDYDAHDFVFAIKAKDINGYANVPVRGARRHLENANRDDALKWFGQMIGDVAGEYDLLRTVALVPVPNSRSVVGCEEPPRTAALAKALATELNAKVTGDALVFDVFRWVEPLLSAHAAHGTRDPRELFVKLRVIGSLGGFRGRRVVLVDDVLTSGGHLQAAVARLAQCGHLVELALVGGRAVDTRVGDPFEIRVDEVPDFAVV